jgi:hypothetical protein
VIVSNPQDAAMTAPIEAPPPIPALDATVAEKQQYAYDMEQYRAVTARMHAQAQADTAVAMDRAAEAQRATVAALNAPQAYDALVWQAALAHPQVTGMTELNVVDNAVKLVSAFAARRPGGVA